MLGEMYELQLDVPKFGKIVPYGDMANEAEAPAAANVAPPSVDFLMATWFAVAPATPTYTVPSDPTTGFAPPPLGETRVLVQFDPSSERATYMYWYGFGDSGQQAMDCQA